MSARVCAARRIEAWWGLIFLSRQEGLTLLYAGKTKFNTVLERFFVTEKFVVRSPFKAASAAVQVLTIQFVHKMITCTVTFNFIFKCKTPKCLFFS